MPKSAAIEVVSYKQVVKNLELIALAEEALERLQFDKREIDRDIAGCESKKREREKALEKFAKLDIKNNPINWKGKTLHLDNGNLSFLTSPGKVTLIKKIASNLDRVLELIRSAPFKKFKKFSRSRPDDLNKELVLQEFEDGRVTNDELELIGVKVAKKEIFNVEINR